MKSHFPMNPSPIFPSGLRWRAEYRARPFENPAGATPLLIRAVLTAAFRRVSLRPGIPLVQHARAGTLWCQRHRRRTFAKPRSRLDKSARPRKTAGPMATNADTPLDQLWKEYSLGFRD